MTIEVRPNLTVGEVQESFSSLFPFLRIEFYENYSNGRLHRKKLTSEAVFSKYILDKGRAVFSINEENTVNEVLSLFSEAYTIKAEVLRKSGNVWLPSSATDAWTLSHQNHIGKVISGQISN